MTLIDDIKRDREAGTPGDWSYVEAQSTDGQKWLGCGVVDENGYEFLWLQNSPEYDIPDARRIARVPRMEAALLAAEECERVLTAMANRVSLYSGGHDDKLVNDAEEALDAFRKALGEYQ